MNTHTHTHAHIEKIIQGMYTRRCKYWGPSENPACPHGACSVTGEKLSVRAGSTSDWGNQGRLPGERGH